MIWLVGMLLVLVLGVVAVLAAGRGGTMDGVAPDRRPTGLAARGPLTGEQLRTVRFPLAVRGYRMADVDAVLDQLARQFEADGNGPPGREEPVPSQPPAQPRDRDTP